MTQKYIYFILASISNPPSVPGVEIIPYLTKTHYDLFDDFSRRHLLVSRLFSNVPIDKEQIENQVSDFVQELFKDLNVKIDGFLPEDYDVKDNNEDITETKILGELSSCFDDLKSFVGNLEIPSDFAEFFSNSYDKTEVDSAPPSSSTNQTDKRVIPKPEPGQTLYLCQVEKCSFYATKDGYKNGTAAKHLKEAHKIKGTDMVGGKFKFQKIKGERLNKK